MLDDLFTFIICNFSLSCYVYCYHLALAFVGSWNAGSTTPGNPYVARFPDRFGNLIEKDIERPEVISDYFEDSDAVDCHNKTRQSDLGLEMHWRTIDCWLRLSTTMVGITVTDTWNAMRYHCKADSGFKDMSVKKFAECLVYDLWNKEWGEDRRAALNLQCIPIEEIDMGSLWGEDDEAAGVEAGLMDSGLAARSPRMIHYLKRTDQVVETGENRKGVDRIRRACSIKADGCYSFGYLGMPKKTMFECANKNCMKSQKRANRHTTKGVFICQNELCLAKHRRDMCGE